MPELERPDGVALHWEERGEGPLVLIANTFNLQRVDGLAEYLMRDRRVVTYDPRGVGRSTRSGPYDLATGADDLEALLEETGPAATVFAIGDGAHRGLIVADRRPDLIERLAITSTGLGRAAGKGFASSTEVLEALMLMMRRDYRSGLRSMVAGAHEDPETDRARVESLMADVPQEAAVAYLDAWIAADDTDLALALGDRLTILGYPGNNWFPLEVFEDMSLRFPEAEFEEAADGPIDRPDLSAELLLRLSAPARA